MKPLDQNLGILNKIHTRCAQPGYLLCAPVDCNGLGFSLFDCNGRGSWSTRGHQTQEQQNTSAVSNTSRGQCRGAA